MIKDTLYWDYIKKVSSNLESRMPRGKCNILISGVSGMIGAVLTDILLYSNRIYSTQYNVTGIGRGKSHAEEMFSEYKDDDSFRFVQHDINNALTEAGAVDYIIHAASNTHPVDYSTDPIGTITANVIGTNNLLEYAVSHGCRRFVFLSSVEIYGENKGDIERFDETYNGYINCNTLRAGYPESKRTGEALCQAYGKKYNLDFVIPRLCRVYGPTMSLRDSKAIAQFIKMQLMMRT